METLNRNSTDKPYDFPTCVMSRYAEPRVRDMLPVTRFNY